MGVKGGPKSGHILIKKDSYKGMLSLTSYCIGPIGNSGSLVAFPEEYCPISLESETGGDDGPWAGGEANLVSDEPVYKFEATPMTSDVSSLLRRHSVIGVASNLEVQCCCIDWLKFASPPVSLSRCQRCSSWPCGFFYGSTTTTTTTKVCCHHYVIGYYSWYLKL